MQIKSTIVVNFYGGPGSGKTTAAMELTVELKKLGIDVEYVPEYAKELVRRCKYDKLQDQCAVTHEQLERIHCLLGSCDVIVTDSPILLGTVYAEGKNVPTNFEEELYLEYSSMKNIDIFVMRSGKYDPRGRMETELQARKIDRDIIELLTTFGMPLSYHKSSEPISNVTTLVRQSLNGQCK